MLTLSRFLGVAALASALVFGASSMAQADDAPTSVPGLVNVPLSGDVHDMATRFSQAVRTSGMTVFARIDHRQAALSRDLALRPTEVIIFGNPKQESPLIQCAQSAGIDLPMKALIWQDKTGKTWLSYNSPSWIAERHGVKDCPAIEPLQKVVDGVIDSVKK